MKNEKTEELFELRHLLEKTAIEQIIVHSDTEQLEDLRDNIKMMSQTRDLEMFKEYDIEFHRGIISATKNELFSQLADIIVQYFSNVSPSEMTKLEIDKTIEEHTLILKALKDKDKDMALHLLDVHLQHSRAFMGE